MRLTSVVNAAGNGREAHRKPSGSDREAIPGGQGEHRFPPEVFPVGETSGSDREPPATRRKAKNRRKHERHVERLRSELDALKLERGCADCGYRGHAVALDFDHLPGFPKLRNIGRLAKDGGRARVYAEVAKCEVVCANCHRVRSLQRGDFARGGVL